MSHFLTVASFNIRKALGTDRKRNPLRVLDVPGEIDPHLVPRHDAATPGGARRAAVRGQPGD